MYSHLGVIIARIGSSRLPGKVLMNFAGKKLLERICDQFELIFDRLIIATTEEAQDDQICNFATARQIPFVRHSPSSDVAGRIVKCLIHHKSDYFFRINADSPFPDSFLYEKSFNILNTNKYDFITNIPGRTYPYGISVEGFNSSLFKRKSVHFDKLQREHITKYFYENINQYNYYKLRSDRVFDNNIRLVIDTKNDAKIIEKLFYNLDKKPNPKNFIQVANAYNKLNSNIN